MKTQSQEKVWNSIASEWHEFKQKPAKHVIEFLSEQKGNILDHGSGAGRNLIKIPKGKLYLIDFSEKMLKLAKKKAEKLKIDIETKTCDLTKLPFLNNFFDSSISISAIHCLPKEKHKPAIKELYRVLKPKAKALIGVWNKDSKRFKNLPKEKYVGWRDKGKRYYYLFEEKEIHDLFKKNGFKIINSLNSHLMINFIVEKK